MSPEEHDLLSRMDERLEFIQDKMGCVLAFKDSAAIDISKLKDHCENQKNLPDRVASLENWRSGIVACLGLVGILLTWGWLTVGGAK